MSLPANGTAWPPKSHSRALEGMAEWSAWYSGDPAQLAGYYESSSRAGIRTRPSQLRGGVVGKAARWFWGQPIPTGQQSTKLHVPLAADICGTSADLLFSEPVNLRADDKNASLQQALDDLQTNGLDAQLHEAAEVTAALGGGYLRVVWDRDVNGALPWTDTVHADMALPEFRWGRLYAVTFWQRLPNIGNERDGVVWRLLERHESGRILHGLYRGKTDSLGVLKPLDDHPDAAHLAPLVDDEGGIPTGTDRLTADYVPNMLPNRLDRGSHQGRSDLQGVTPFLDALDEAYSSWWRDIRHGKSRIHVPESYLTNFGPGQGAAVDLDREVYVPLAGVLPSKEQLMIESAQLKIRVEEHAATCQAWTERIIESAGYSTQSLSSGAGGAVTAAEVYSHERRSYMTRGKKARYWTAAVQSHLQTLVEVANANLGAGIREGDFSVEFQDGVQDSADAMAGTAEKLFRAQSASAETRVRMLHPDWDDTEVLEETERILRETQVSEPVPIPEDAGL